MPIDEQIRALHARLPKGVTLVAVSKTYPVEAIAEAFRAGQRIFGESRPQELKAKYEALPKEIRWHMIGHLQTNKIKYIAPFVELIHSVDSARLIEAIDKEARKNDRVIDILLEVFIATEESKSGWEQQELLAYLQSGAHLKLQNIRMRGLMGIASLTDDAAQIRTEFTVLRDFFLYLQKEHFAPAVFDTLSMGMTSDWEIAVECGSNMVRIGSMIFGARNYGI